MTSNQQNQQPKMLENRTFGLIFAGIFAVIALFPLISGGDIRQWAGIISLAFASVAIVFPSLLLPLNKFWVKFGLFMHKIVNPILMGLVFFVAVFPTGMVLKLLGKDPMRRKLDSATDTYWIERDEPLSKESFDNQF